MKDYKPKPIDTSEVILTAEVEAMAEIIAKNVHEIWAKSRIEQGWHYGPKRNDLKKEHPCLVPYEDLSELEKDYDRRTGLESLKIMIKLGFEIKKTL